MIDQLYSNNFIIDWWDFFLTALDVGWTYERVFLRIESGFGDSQFDGNTVTNRLKEMYNAMS